MNNPALIVSVVDRRLDHEVRLVLYGRAALCLGFPMAPAETGTTKDVDCIISEAQSLALENDPNFWEAIEGANAELKNRGLYITHLFRDSEIFLRTGWTDHLVTIPAPGLKWLKLFRPATIDLVLTKMMRGDDPQDMADAKFMIEHEGMTKAQLEAAFAEMKPIELVELRDAFARAKPLVLGMVRN